MVFKVASADWVKVARATPRRVLVVDDVAEIARVMRLAAQALARPRLEVAVAHSGEEALAALWRGRFDLVISDYRMPGVDGLEVLRVARLANPRGYRWLMTAYNEVPASPERVRAASLDALLHKPVPTDLFFRMLSGTFAGDARLIGRLREAASSLVYNEEVEPRAPASVVRS